MSKERASLGFSSELESFDPSEWNPNKKNTANDRAKREASQKAAEASGFKSREPNPTQTSVAKQRRRRTGRNAQFNIKTKPETIEAFYAIADGQGWGLGETLEQAVLLLEERYSRSS